MRPQIALVPFLFLPLAACGAHSDGTTAAAPPAVTTTAPTVAASPAGTPSKEPAAAKPNKPAGTEPSKKPAKVAKVSKATPSGSRDPRWGTQYAILVSSKLSTRRITYDLIEWYDGNEAVKACAEDGVKPAENDYCTGYYSRNNNKKLRTLTVYPDAPIHVGPALEARPVDLKTFLAEVSNGNVISFDVDANRIMKLDQVFLP